MPPVPTSAPPLDLPKITTGAAASPADLIDLEESLFAPLPAPRGWWAFRGQSQSFGTLVPSFQRIFKERRSVGAAEIIEKDLIETFREHYEKLGERTKDMPEPRLIGPGYDLRCLCVMQHYGVPSRLLDWTSDFWTAVYFACAGDPSKEAELWMYDRRIFAEQASQAGLDTLLRPIDANTPLPPPEPPLFTFREKRFIAELDPQITPRMREQHAHHTFTSDVFADHGPQLFELATKTAPDGEVEKFFRRILIAGGCKEKALRFLDQQKEVTAGTIFPDVEGLGKFLHWHLESLVTTLL